MSSDKNNSQFIYTDEELIKNFQKGNEDAYVQLVNRYKEKLINFVFRMIGDLEQSEDIVQETMIKLYYKKHYYREVAKNFLLGSTLLLEIKPIQNCGKKRENKRYP